MVELIKDGWKIRLYPAIRSLSELKFRLATANPRGGTTATFADNTERDRALARRVAELTAQGWVDARGPRKPAAAPKAGARATKATATKTAPTTRAATAARAPAATARRAAALEEAFAALVEKTLAALGRAATEAEDARAWRSAIAAYGRLAVRAGGDPTNHLVHFFAVDGIALDRRHPVVVHRARATRARKARWLRLLDAAR